MRPRRALEVSSVNHVYMSSNRDSVVGVLHIDGLR